MKLGKSHYGLNFGGMMQFTMMRITVCSNGHTQLIFAFSALGRPRVLSLSGRIFFSSRTHWSEMRSFPPPTRVWDNNIFNSFTATGKLSLAWLWVRGAFSQQDKIHWYVLNSLAPGRFRFNFRKVIFKLTLVNCGWGISYEIALRWMPQDLTDDKSTLVQVTAWCRQATSHYLSQSWPRSMSPNGVTGPQWVNSWFGTKVPNKITGTDEQIYPTMKIN